jgi:hypothetical protein
MIVEDIGTDTPRINNEIRIMKKIPLLEEVNNNTITWEKTEHTVSDEVFAKYNNNFDSNKAFKDALESDNPIKQKIAKEILKEIKS